MYTLPTSIDFSRWFVALTDAETLFVCAGSKHDALATVIDKNVQSILSWEEYRKIHCLAGDTGASTLSYAVGLRHPNSIVTGTVILM